MSLYRKLRRWVMGRERFEMPSATQHAISAAGLFYLIEEAIKRDGLEATLDKMKAVNRLHSKNHSAAPQAQGAWESVLDIAREINKLETKLHKQRVAREGGE